MNQQFAVAQRQNVLGRISLAPFLTPGIVSEEVTTRESPCHSDVQTVCTGSGATSRDVSPRVPALSPIDCEDLWRGNERALPEI